MTLQRHWYENDTRFIPAHFQPGVLIDLARDREVDLHRLLRGTSLFPQDVLHHRVNIAPRQFLQLADNAQRLLGGNDTAFLFGQRLLPGHYGAVSDALRHADHLQQALELLVRYRALLSPLLAPRLLLDDHYAYLYWLDACGSGDLQRFLVEASMTAVHALCRLQAGEKLPWSFHFSYPQPRHIEQYWVHLGQDIHFCRHIDLMKVPRGYLMRPWPHAARLAGSVAREDSDKQLRALGFNASFLDCLFSCLQSRVRQPPKLEQVAQDFAMSPATLKRTLKKHDTGFQEQLDHMRKYVALYLLQIRGFSNDDVAGFLQFHDSNNFRRSFKRWTGVVPSEVRQNWIAAG